MTSNIHAANRIGWIDTLKGIGIISVVIGHIFPEHVARYIFLFHMPLFFFIGGILFKPSPDAKEFLRKKAFHLLVPYVAFLCVIYVPCEISELMDRQETITQAIARPILGGRHLAGYCAVFWYITCFFLVQQVMNFLLNNVRKSFIAPLMLLCLLVSYSISYWLPKFWLPWNADVVLAAMPIFYLGYLYRTYQHEIAQFKWVWFLLAICAMMLTYFYPDNKYMMKDGGYGIPFVTLVCSLIIIITLIEISKLIVPVALLNKPLSIAGQASMVIMYLHEPPQFYVLEHYGLRDPYLRFLIAMTVSVGGYYLINSLEIGRALFMGSIADFNKIFRRSKLATV
jgi:polysaccharide biosynthesis protein PslL